MKVLCLPAFTQFFQIMSFRVAAHKVMKGVRGKKATINSREFVAVRFFSLFFPTKLFTCPRSASAPLKRLINGSNSVNRSHKYVALVYASSCKTRQFTVSVKYLCARAPDERKLPWEPAKLAARSATVQNTLCNDFHSFM